MNKKITRLWSDWCIFLGVDIHQLFGRLCIGFCEHECL